jgi:hypothetical protein
VAISLRLTKAKELALERAARRAGVSKSEFLRQCLDEKLERIAKPSSAYELGKDLFGGVLSGRSDLAANAKQIVREKIHAKARRS